MIIFASQYSHNLTDNYPWFNEDLLEQLMSLSSYTLSLFYNSEEKKRFTGGKIVLLFREGRSTKSLEIIMLMYTILNF